MAVCLLDFLANAMRQSCKERERERARANLSVSAKANRNANANVNRGDLNSSKTDSRLSLFHVRCELLYLIKLVCVCACVTKSEQHSARTRGNQHKSCFDRSIHIYFDFESI